MLIHKSYQIETTALSAGDDRHALVGRGADSAGGAKTSRQIGTSGRRRAGK
ncbi:MAG TPA: hypothetical protein VH560_06820 [Polyangia bacterium]|nr:hypothetical protein [Polyangia bacterium]